MGIISKTVVKQRRNVEKTYYQLKECLRTDIDKITELYEQVIFYLPYTPTMNLNKVLTEIRKLMVSDILVSDVGPSTGLNFTAKL
jgi:uncharacterized membrane protein